MTRYLYIIETQKPTGISRFIKVFDSPLVIDKETVTKTTTKIFNDRVEVYIYLTTLEVDIWEDLIEEFKSIVKEFNMSLEFTRDNYVYLIEKTIESAGLPIIHKLLTLPNYNKREPIPFYPEKDDKEEWSPAKYNPEENDFYTEKYFKIFTERFRSLSYFYRNCSHSIPYIVFESFILTYGEFQSLSISTENFPNIVKHYQIEESEDNYCNPNRITDFKSVGDKCCNSEETYLYYIKPTLCGQVITTGNGQFFSLLNPNEISRIFWNFMYAAEKWSNK